MYARVSSIQIQPARLAEMSAAMPAVGAQLKAIPGMLECKTCWDNSGKGVVFALYDSQAAAEASAETIRNIWGGLMGFLAAPPTVTTGSEVIDLLA